MSGCAGTLAEGPIGGVKAGSFADARPRLLSTPPPPPLNTHTHPHPYPHPLPSSSSSFPRRRNYLYFGRHVLDRACKDKKGKFSSSFALEMLLEREGGVAGTHDG